MHLQGVVVTTRKRTRSGAALADTRQITAGTTLAIEWKEPKGQEKVRHRVPARLDLRLHVRRATGRPRPHSRPPVRRRHPACRRRWGRGPDGRYAVRGRPRRGDGRPHARPRHGPHPSHREGAAMATLRVRIYNVRFGDAVLVSIPEATAARPYPAHADRRGQRPPRRRRRRRGLQPVVERSSSRFTGSRSTCT